MSKVTIRKITGREDHPQLYLTKELRELRLKKGDMVAVVIEDNKIVIQRAKIKIGD